MCGAGWQVGRRSFRCFSELLFFTVGMEKGSSAGMEVICCVSTGESLDEHFQLSQRI